jgi:ABC-type lipoprotein release transport system permease subunit
MMLTFLNLVVVSGILIGLIEGAVKANAEQHTGDVFLSTPDGERNIEQSDFVIQTVDSVPGIKNTSKRFVESASIEANYRTRRDPQEVRDTVGTRIVGIDPLQEDALSGLSNYVAEGEYLAPGDEGHILLGSYLVEKYAPDYGDAFPTLSGVEPGSRVRVTVGENTKEFKVKGIIVSKVDETSFRAFMLEDEFKRFAGRSNLNINEMAIKVLPGYPPAEVKANLIASGIDQYAWVRLSREALPQALEDIVVTFDLLGNAISSIGLLVSSITIFIVVFVNAITRRKYIGILKGIGIRPWAIELSYVFQSLFYALLGSLLAIIVIYAFLVPFFDAHPVDFPFSDGILVAPVGGTMARLLVLVLATLIAGYIPAWMIIKRNTLDAILGR